MTETTTTEAKEATMFDTFSADRAEWVAAGRPADTSFAHWARCVEQAERTERPAFVAPLVVFG